MSAETAPEVQYSKPARKRESNSDTELVKQSLLDMCGNDSWSPLLCGYAHRLRASFVLQLGTGLLFCGRTKH